LVEAVSAHDLLSGWKVSRKIFPEIVRIEYPENINDRGIDVYIEGQQSHVGVGFQIKSDNDLRDTDILPNFKR